MKREGRTFEEEGRVKRILNTHLALGHFVVHLGVGEGSSDHDSIVPAPRSVRVEVTGSKALRLEVLACERGEKKWEGGRSDRRQRYKGNRSQLKFDSK